MQLEDIFPMIYISFLSDQKCDYFNNAKKIESKINECKNAHKWATCVVKCSFCFVSPSIKWPGYGQTSLAIAQNVGWYILSMILMCANPSSPPSRGGGGHNP